MNKEEFLFPTAQSPLVVKSSKKISDRFLVVTFFTALFFDIYGGVLRYAFSTMGVLPLIYIPKIAMGLCLIAGFFVWFPRGVGSTSFPILFCSLAFLVAIVVGIINDLPFSQLIFGFSIYMPLLFGMQLGMSTQAKEWLTLKAISLAFGSVALGVIINYIVGDTPWAGSSYSVGGIEVEGNRAWTHANISRLSGFSRISTQAGIQAAGISLMVYALLMGRKRAKYFGPIILVSALLIVGLTTTKSALGALFIVMLIIPIIHYFLFSISMGVLCIALVGLPLAAYSYVLSLDYSDPVSAILLSSFDERLIYTWPITFGLIERLGIFGFGVGMGGVGTPAKTLGGIVQGDFFSGDLGLSFTDNLALYLYGNLGLIGVLLLVLLVVATVDLCRSNQPERVAVGLACVCLLLCGLTVDMMEMLFAPLLFGLCIGLRFSRKKAVQVVPNNHSCR